MSKHSKTPYMFYFEEQKNALNNSGKTSSEISLGIGQKWQQLTHAERQPYVEMKNQFDEQMKREQNVNKAFKKKEEEIGSQSLKNSKTSIQDQSEQQKIQNSEDQKKKQGTLNPPKFTKEDLKKQSSASQNKVLINKVNNQGKVIASNVQQPTQTSQQIQQSSQQQKPQQNKQVDKSEQDKHPNHVANDTHKQNHQAYLDFYKEKFKSYQKRFPNRPGNELTKVIKEEWNCVKLQNKIQQKQKKDENKITKKIVSNNDKLIEIDEKKVEVPQKPISGFLRYYQSNFKEIKQKNPKLESNEIAKIASEKWNKFSKEEKEVYNGPYKKENAEYLKKIADFKSKYHISPQVKSSEKSNNKSKNFIMIDGKKVFYPIKLSGYYLFEKQLREELKIKSHQLDSIGISKFIGEQWKELSIEDKKSCEAQSQLDYEKQKNDFIKKYGEIPEKPKRAQPKPSEKKASQNLNIKRSAPTDQLKNLQQSQNQVQKKPQLTMEEREEQMNKKHERKMQINYEDVESEVDDINSLIDISDSEEEEDSIDRYGNFHSRKVSLKTKDEEDFERIELQFTKSKKLKTEEPKQAQKYNTQSKPISVLKPVSTHKSASVRKPQNSLFEMLNQPVPHPELLYGPNFF